jgi:hypothetical protein
MIDAAEYAAGARRAEAELPNVVEYDLRWLIAVGTAR